MLCSSGSPTRFPLSDGAGTLSSITLPETGRRGAAALLPDDRIGKHGEEEDDVNRDFV